MEDGIARMLDPSQTLPRTEPRLLNTRRSSPGRPPGHTPKEGVTFRVTPPNRGFVMRPG